MAWTLGSCTSLFPVRRQPRDMGQVPVNGDTAQADTLRSCTWVIAHLALSGTATSAAAPLAAPGRLSTCPALLEHMQAVKPLQHESPLHKIIMITEPLATAFHQRHALVSGSQQPPPPPRVAPAPPPPVTPAAAATAVAAGRRAGRYRKSVGLHTRANTHTRGRWSARGGGCMGGSQVRHGPLPSSLGHILRGGRRGLGGGGEGGDGDETGEGGAGEGGAGEGGTGEGGSGEGGAGGDGGSGGTLPVDAHTAGAAEAGTCHATWRVASARARQGTGWPGPGDPRPGVQQQAGRHLHGLSRA